IVEQVADSVIKLSLDEDVILVRIWVFQPEFIALKGSKRRGQIRREGESHGSLLFAAFSIPPSWRDGDSQADQRVGGSLGWRLPQRSPASDICLHLWSCEVAKTADISAGLPESAQPRAHENVGEALCQQSLSLIHQIDNHTGRRHRGM